MNRIELLTLEQSRAYRNVTWAEQADVADEERLVKVDRPEIRASKDGQTLTYFGHAAVTENEYKVYGGPPFGWVETMARGAFKRTLLNNADVAFLVNHEGLTLARTKSGTLTLDEDSTGLRTLAELDPSSNSVNDLRSAVDRGDIDEMSFAFRVVADEWTDDDGQPDSPATGTHRRVLEVNLNKGDVSAVNYGANPATSGGFRDLDRALAELRAGKALTDEQRAMVRSFAQGLDDLAPEAPQEMVLMLQLHELRHSA